MEDKKNINEKIVEAGVLIGKKDYEKAKDILNEYINENKDSYKSDDVINYSFKNLSEFYLFVNKVVTKKQTFWINAKVDDAYRLLGYIAVEEQEYDKALDYLKESLKYNPVNLDTFFEMTESYKMNKDLKMMKETLDGLYEYIHEPVSLSRYYRNLGFYYIEKEEYELAFSLYLISLEYDFNQFALSEMLYIRKMLKDNEYNISKKDAIKMIENNGIRLGISESNLSLLNNLSKDKKLEEKNKKYILKIRNDIKILTKTIK